jgi:hypothetical protein
VGVRCDQLAVGGLAVGGLAVGGLAVGGLAVAGLAVGGLAVGELAVGELGVRELGRRDSAGRDDRSRWSIAATDVVDLYSAASGPRGASDKTERAAFEVAWRIATAGRTVAWTTRVVPEDEPPLADLLSPVDRGHG